MQRLTSFAEKGMIKEETFDFFMDIGAKHGLSSIIPPLAASDL